MGARLPEEIENRNGRFNLEILGPFLLFSGATNFVSI